MCSTTDKPHLPPSRVMRASKNKGVKKIANFYRRWRSVAVPLATSRHRDHCECASRMAYTLERTEAAEGATRAGSGHESSIGNERARRCRNQQRRILQHDHRSNNRRIVRAPAGVSKGSATCARLMPEVRTPFSRRVERGCDMPTHAVVLADRGQPSSALGARRSSGAGRSLLVAPVGGACTAAGDKAGHERSSVPAQGGHARRGTRWASALTTLWSGSAASGRERDELEASAKPARRKLLPSGGRKPTCSSSMASVFRLRIVTLRQWSGEFESGHPRLM